MELITECHPEVKAKLFEAITSVCGGCDFIYDDYYSRYLPETHYGTKCGAAEASSGVTRLIPESGLTGPTSRVQGTSRCPQLQGEGFLPGNLGDSPCKVRLC